jgi:hypothetical protein
MLENELGNVMAKAAADRKRLVNQSRKTVERIKKNSQVPFLSVIIFAAGIYWSLAVCSWCNSVGRPNITTMLFTAMTARF